MGRNVKKLLAICMALVLVVGLLSACGQNGEGSGTTVSESGTTESSDKAQTGGIETSSSEPEELTLPITTEPLTLTYFRSLDPKVAASLTSLGEVGCYKEMEKKTGIHIEFQHPPAGQESEQFNLMLASQELPDIIFWNWLSVAGGPAKVISDGNIIKLNDLIGKYAPNLTKVFEEMPEAKKQSILDDGTMYMFPFIRGDKSLQIYWGPQIRKDWLDKVGLEVPETIDDWYNALRAFKQNDPNDNGKADELPFVSSKAGGLQNFESAWGILHGWYLKNGKIAYGPIEPAYKEYLTTMNKWYKEGLIDPDYASTDGKSFDAKITGNVGGSYFGLVGGNLQKYMSLMTQQDPKFELIGASYPIGPVGKSYNTSADALKIVNGGGAAISGKCEHQKEATKWLDYHYSEEGHMLVNFGIEDESYVMENNYPQYTDIIMKNPQGLSFWEALARYALSPYDGPIVQDKAYLEQSFIFPQQKQAIEAWTPADTSLIVPNITPTEEESSRVASIMGDINTYVSEMFDKFVMGQEPLDNFDQYIERVKSMGIDEAIQIQQTALDRYNARK